jgi:hypothetical protein
MGMAGSDLVQFPVVLAVALTGINASSSLDIRLLPVARDGWC